MTKQPQQYYLVRWYDESDVSPPVIVGNIFQKNKCAFFHDASKLFFFFQTKKTFFVDLRGSSAIHFKTDHMVGA